MLVKDLIQALLKLDGDMQVFFINNDEIGRSVADFSFVDTGVYETYENESFIDTNSIKEHDSVVLH